MSDLNIIVLEGGRVLTLDECKRALDDAMRIIEKVGTVGVETGECSRMADAWMKRYYPQWA